MKPVLFIVNNVSKLILTLLKHSNLGNAMIELGDTQGAIQNYLKVYNFYYFS